MRRGGRVCLCNQLPSSLRQTRSLPIVVRHFVSELAHVATLSFSVCNTRRASVSPAAFHFTASRPPVSRIFSITDSSVIPSALPGRRLHNSDRTLPSDPFYCRPSILSSFMAVYVAVPRDSDILRCETIRDAILTRAQKPT